MANIMRLKAALLIIGVSLSLSAVSIRSTASGEDSSDCALTGSSSSFSIPGDYKEIPTDPPKISGPTEVSRPGGYQYQVSGGMEPYTWTVSAAGGAVDDKGYVTLTGSACGSFSISVKDRTDRSDSMEVRVANAGGWVQTEKRSCGVNPNGCVCGGWGHCLSPEDTTIISGKIKRLYSSDKCRCCVAGGCNKGPPAAECGSAQEISYSLNNYCWSECGLPSVRTDREAHWYCYITGVTVYEWRCP